MPILSYICNRVIPITPCVQEHALDKVLADLPQLTASNVILITPCVQEHALDKVLADLPQLTAINVIPITPCVQEHALDNVLADLPRLTASNVAALSHFVESTYTDQSALANNQIEVRGQIAEHLQSLLRKEVKGQVYILHVYKRYCAYSSLQCNCYLQHNIIITTCYGSSVPQLSLLQLQHVMGRVYPN